MFYKKLIIFCSPLLLLSTFSAQADIQLKFGVYTSDQPLTMVKKFRPLLSALETGLSQKLSQMVKIKMVVAKDYDTGINDLVSGKVDFSRFGPASYIKAKQLEPGIKLLAMESKKGKKVFKGVICVARHSDIQTLAQLKGKRFAFGNKNSTIGRYLAQNHLLAAGVHAADFTDYAYLGRHDKVGAAVAAGQFDGGALKAGTYKTLLKKGKALRIIGEFENVTKPWLASKQLSLTMVAALTEVLLEMKDVQALKALKKDGFLVASDADYAPIRQAIEQNHEFFQ
ncbi:PhnD/SsuA/transferrin family substrate-binding protein [Candidatus Venteria ishoeyi]|uniref:PhnD/SsuA/transferrin family substrate-binding protein n=1 Tax=Candidatus Venteria ishoeyi TaxID=1899563 RepID=UPI0025A559C4|nr:PhnD/SsuA/transferrin family substrate-binding protein [Candidatus Venteria ishoeyi]MDM8546551.1 PhnD/SsuA/transferrin family substrate-binding protein [Candidatus Venteria ishoeyi]